MADFFQVKTFKIHGITAAFDNFKKQNVYLLLKHYNSSDYVT